MSPKPIPTTIRMKYTGPKVHKTLDLPLGVQHRYQFTHQVIFAAKNQMIGEVPAQFVEVLLTLPEHYQYADDAARQSYAVWLTAPPPIPHPCDLNNTPVAASSHDTIIEPMPRPVRDRVAPELAHFEEFA